MFSDRLKELRKSIKSTDVDPNAERLPPTSDTGQFDLFGQARGNSGAHDPGQSPDLIRPELIYTMDIDGVIGSMKRARSGSMPKQSYNFYNACLDRIDQLITERNSRANKNDLVNILRELSYFRPKEDDQKEKMRKEQGNYSKQEAQDDILSVRHKRLIEEKSNKFRTVPGDMANFVFQNLSKGFFKDMFT